MPSKKRVHLQQFGIIHLPNPYLTYIRNSSLFFIFSPSDLQRNVDGVNTKNWYREETDMWAKFGRRAPFGRRFSSKHSVEASAVGSTSSFGRRTVPRVKAESIQECVMTWIEYKEGDELMTGTRQT
jgi:hypothetical protein